MFIYFLVFWGEILALGGPKKRKGNENPTKVFFWENMAKVPIFRGKKRLNLPYLDHSL
jgi:hypothetical protein